MPVHNGHGYGAFTADKQAAYRELLAAHLRIVQSIQRKNVWVTPIYQAFDLTAGCGVNPSDPDEPGSPLILLEEAIACADLAVDAWFFERDALSIETLEVIVPVWLNELAKTTDRFGCSIVAGDHNVTVEHIVSEFRRGKYYGLIYADPTGKPIPVHAIRTLLAAPALARVDVLVHVAANGPYKRPRSAGAHDRYLLDDLEAIGKKHLYIREPVGREEWTFAFLTNWGEYPEFKKLRMVRADSEVGRSILDRLNLTKRERRDRMQLRLVPHSWGAEDGGISDV